MPDGPEDGQGLPAGEDGVHELTEEDVVHAEVGREEAILAPKMTLGKSGMKELKMHDRSDVLRPGSTAAEQRPSFEFFGHSSFDKARMRALKEIENIEKRATPMPAYIEGDSVEAQLQRLDFKMDRLSRQMNECLAGLLAVHRKRNGHAAPHHRPLCSDLIPMANDAGEHSHGGRASSLANPPGRVSVQSHDSDPHAAPTSHEDHERAVHLAEVFRREPPRESVMSSSVYLHRRSDDEQFASVSHSANVEAHRHPGRRSTSSGQSISSWIAKRQRTQSPMTLKMWKFLENPESSLAAQLYNVFMPAFILMSVMLSIAHATAPAFLSGAKMAVAEIAIESVFLLEIIMRFFVCPNRCIFFRSVYNIIDILSGLPLILRLVQGAETGFGNHGSDAKSERSFDYLVIIGFVPAVRLLKTWRRFQQVHLLAKAFKLAFEALPVMLFIYVVVWLFFTAAIFVIEEQNNIETLGQAMWLTFCSMTASIFGDVHPATDAGKMIVSALVLISILYMAIPIGIIGTCFSEIWANRDQILLVERLRRVFKQNGFTARDIPHLFSYFDVDNSGLLNWEEFKSMADILKLGLSEDRLLSLFHMFDNDGSGGIDDQEFCRTVFPEAFPLLYGEGCTDRDTLGKRFTLMPWGSGQ